MIIKKKKYYYPKSTSSTKKSLQNDVSLSESKIKDDYSNVKREQKEFSETQQLKLLKPKKEQKPFLTPEVEKTFTLDDLPPPVREMKFLSNKQKEDFVGTSEKYKHQFICRWPGCGQTNRLIRNLQTHIRTVHFKFLKTKLSTGKLDFPEIEAKVSQYIYNTLS